MTDCPNPARRVAWADAAVRCTDPEHADAPEHDTLSCRSLPNPARAVLIHDGGPLPPHPEPSCARYRDVEQVDAAERLYWTQRMRSLSFADLALEVRSLWDTIELAKHDPAEALTEHGLACLTLGLEIARREQRIRNARALRGNYRLEREAWNDRIRSVKERADLAEIALGDSDRVQFGRPGSREFKVRCPVHDDVTPSCHIYGDEQRWWCYGCSRGGDVFDWVKAAGRTDFAGALRLLEDRYGRA
jgi:hypothetical protein